MSNDGPTLSPEQAEIMRLRADLAEANRRLAIETETSCRHEDERDVLRGRCVILEAEIAGLKAIAAGWRELPDMDGLGRHGQGMGDS